MLRILALVSMVLLAALGEAWAQYGAELMTGGGAPTQVAGTTGNQINGPALLFTMGEHTGANAASLVQSPPYQYNGGTQVGAGNDVCTWTFPSNAPAVPAGSTIIGYTHLADSTDTYPAYTTSINFGSTPMEYNSSPVEWTPFPEDIQLFYLRNVPGGVTTVSMQQVYTNGAINPSACADIGVEVYSGVKAVVPIAPTYVTSLTPSVTITPTAPALIMGFASPFGNDSAGALTSPSGYSLILDNLETDDIGTWGSNSLVSAPQTLTWSAPQGTVPPGCSFNSGEACGTVVMGAALQGAGAPQQIASTTISNESFAAGAPIGTIIGTLSTGMTPATPVFSGSYSMSGTAPGCTAADSVNNADVSINGSNLQVNAAGLGAGNYFVCVAATEAGISNSPQGQAFALTASSSGSVPPPAAAAGFTTLAINYDWTGKTLSGYDGGQQVNLSTAPLSSWLQPCGAPPPSSPGQVTPFAIGTGSTNDCGAYSIVNDGGTTALEMSNGSASTHYGMGSGYYQSDNGINIPTQFYVEYRARFLNTSGSNCCSAFWVVTQCSGCFYNEIVFFEMYSDDPNATGAGGWTFRASNNPENHCMYESSPGYCPDALGPGSQQSSWTSTQYHTYGERITQDPSGDMATCFYLDGNQINIYSNGPGSYLGNCLTNTPVAGYPYAFPVGVTIWAGGSTNPSAPVTNFIEYEKVYTCSNWKAANPASTGNGAACVTPTLVTSNP